MPKKNAEQTNIVSEKISDEELKNIRNLKQKSAYLTTIAEKAYVEAKNAELSYENAILLLINKYKLDLQNGDNIMEDGSIKRNTSKENK